MDRTLIWTERASADIEAIVRYILRRNPTAATAIGMGIYDRAQILLHQPEVGSILDELREGGWRKLIFRRWKIIYRIEDDVIVIGRVWPAAMGEADLTTRRYLDPERVKKFLEDDTQVSELPELGQIQFVISFVREGTPSQVSDRIGQVLNLANSHGATVHHIVGQLVIMAFGTCPGSESSSGKRTSLVHALVEQLAGDINIVSGEAQGHYGNLGSEHRMSYTFLVPQFDLILGALSGLAFGESEELSGGPG